MLARAARRRHALRYVAAEQSQALQIPWLCPALYRSRSDIRLTTTITSRPPGRRKSRSAGSTTLIRHLASATDSTDSFLPSQDAFVPFPSSGYPSAPLRTRNFDFGTSTNDWISPFQRSGIEDILSIDNTIALPPPRLITPRRIGIEIHGDAHDIEVTLEACLQLHRWSRAFALLKQLELVYKHNSYSPEMLLESYNRTLEAMVMDLITNRSKTNIDRINRWIEVDMKQAGVEPDAHTYALKLKVALATMSSGSKRDRTVRRYWELAKQRHTGSEVVGRAILTDSDLGKLSQICPEMMFGTLHEEIESTHVERQASEQGDMKILEPGQKGLGLSSLRESLSVFLNKENTSAQRKRRPTCWKTKILPSLAKYVSRLTR